MRRRTNAIPKLHVKKDDTVKVLSGQYRGQQGRVLSVNPRKQTAIVEDINLATKHLKPTQDNPQGEIKKTEAAIRVCKLQVIDPSSGQPTRIGRQRNEKGSWVRVAKKTGNVLN